MRTPLTLSWLLRVSLIINLAVVFFYIRRCPMSIPVLKPSPHNISNLSNLTLTTLPLDLPNVQQAVADLKCSKSQPGSPINLRYRNIKYMEGSMECSKEHEKHFSVLILVKTRRSEIDRRVKARKFLSNQTFSSKLGVYIQYGFLIGQSEENVSTEIEEYNDFIIGDFEDTYENLTYKSQMGIRWAAERCPHFNFVVSLDVDTHLYLDKLLKFLKDPYNYPKVNPALEYEMTVSSRSNFYAGRVISARGPERNNKSVYYLSEADFAPSVFPPFIAGMAIILSKETVMGFYCLSPYVQHIHIEDSYFGMLAHKLGIVPFDISGLVFDGLFKFWYSEEFFKNGGLNNVLTIHHIETVENYLNPNGSHTNVSTNSGTKTTVTKNNSASTTRDTNNGTKNNLTNSTGGNSSFTKNNNGTAK